MKRALLLGAWAALTALSALAFLTLPRGWNLLMGAAAATFAAISITIGWSQEPDPDGDSGNEERRLP